MPQDNSLGSILVVDDSQDEVLLLTRYLSPFGLGAIEAVSCPDQAIQRLKAALDGHGLKPSILLLDVRLGATREGWEVLAWVRRQRDLHDLKVMLLTGLLTPEINNKALRRGADTCVAKPTNHEDYEHIAETIHLWLARQPTGSQASVKLTDLQIFERVCSDHGVSEPTALWPERLSESLAAARRKVASDLGKRGWGFSRIRRLLPISERTFQRAR